MKIVSLWAILAPVLVVVGACSSGGDGVPGANPPQNRPPLDPACKTDSECLTLGGHCDPLRGCVSCVFDWHCQEGERCNQGVCAATVQCTTGEDCSNTSTPSCDPVLKECVRCSRDSDCSENERCSDHNCRPYTPCVNSLDCPLNLVCDRDAGECVSCVADADCVSEKLTCVNNTCVARCESDKECAGSKLLCDAERAHCVQCVEQVDCPSVYHCDDGLCELDVCEQGKSSCAETGNAIVACDALGANSEVRPCNLGETCVPLGDQAACVPWLCTPGELACDSSSRYVSRCADDGLSWATADDCNETGGVCVSGACVDRVCEAGESACVGGHPYLCDAIGISQTETDHCLSYEYCDGATGTCKEQLCDPGEPYCDGNVVKTCDDIGSGFESEDTDCADDGEVCSEGQCVAKVCEPNTYSCEGQEIYLCNEQGSESTFMGECNPQFYCDADAGGCSLQVCSPGAPYCVGDTLHTCNAQGSGGTGTTVDCAATGNVCYAGACVPKLCSGSFFCQNNDVYSCSNNGSSSSIYDDCGATEYCAENDSTCNAVVCTPGGKICNGALATTCNAVGSGYEAGGTDCAADGKVCAGGVCLPKICEPNSYFCSGTNPHKCDATGAASTLNDTCTAAEFCKQGTSLCQTDVCTAGANVCNGESIAVCLPDGSGPGANVTDCTQTSQVCEGGVCKNVVCVANQRFCDENGNVRLCNAKGTNSSAHTTCTSAQYCGPSGSTVACLEDVCVASGPACNGEAVAVCNANGSGYASTSTDCSATNQVCTPASGCVSSALDTVGLDTSTSTTQNRLRGIRFAVTKTRHLKQIEAYAAVSGTSIFTWAVYSATSETGTFTKVFETTTSSSGNPAFHSSGAIDVTLEAGKFYFIAVSIAGTHTAYFRTNDAPKLVSFGRALSGYAATLSGSLPATLSITSNDSSSYYLRLTTGP
jgi:hypothetical protein